MTDEKKKIKFHDWMTRIASGETGEDGAGSEITGSEAEEGAKLALDKIVVARSQKTPGEAGGKETASRGTMEEEKSRGERLHVMILDDEPIVGKRLNQTLTKSGLEVEVLEDPEKAMSRLAETHFDVVVTDFRMDRLDGIQILEYIISNCKNTRVILITGYATVEVAREALLKGAFDFIAKPFKPRDLRAVINKAALSLGFRGID